MFSYIIKKIVGSQNDREIRRLQEIVDTANEFEDKVVKLTNSELGERTSEFRENIKNEFSLNGKELDDSTYEKIEEYLWEIMPESFAIVREAGRRTIGMRHFDVQMIGGIVMHKSRIAEMKTGEGKTLVAALSLFLNGITGLGAHLITVNDYLAGRDAMWMGPIYRLLGLSVGVINHDVSYLIDWESKEKAEKAINSNLSVWPEEYLDKDIPPERNLDVLSAFKTTLVPCSRKEAYKADITYGTNNEFGFDYLRDNMKFSLDDYVQRGHNFAIVDEVDSILIDEARTPLIISGPSEDSTQLYYEIDKIVKDLKNESDFTIDEKTKQVNLNDSGTSKIEKVLGIGNLYDPSNLELLHHVNQGLRAHNLFLKMLIT